MDSITKNKWIQYEEKENVKLRLFCLPYAGGGSSIYRLWQKSMPEHIQVCKIQLPGRENRIDEQAIDSMEDLVKTLAKQLFNYLDKPFALFGHSMGAMATYELAKYLSNNTPYSPKHVFVSGCRTPNTPHNHITYHLEGEEFIDSLRQRGGTNEVLLNNKDYMKMVEPTLRADLKLIERWHHNDIETLNCPLTVLGGVNDTLVLPTNLKQWHQYTNKIFELKLFEGDHFFINDDSHNIASIVANTLKQ
ncbi:Oleoyl-(acyl-carrier-protein) hydrolase [Arcobacter nitrofigilis DSM 7299]|uniref:Oleoyl-(Acyl-carrier-protein) hydrolase n=1 Tax=Arcobacter nitrofigilis (strain ATCC 33309 / DSM 7299 / CCUG 15893 / LMG 7604 / NCTC 12251 / CI) TaxID=572480 RepID=D5V0Q4_ARCNC|nr:thioesterase domain-containing protein [Arcobacter nitrofigilis]ADG93866.1 Oleoyl-(acyl-carrier-protein) hydrolase [Arcobacter nitrofigilis DSM 7299]